MQAEKWEELCLWAGFHQKRTCDWDNRDFMEWRHSIGQHKCMPYMSSKLPPQDMNSVFMWFWPKLKVVDRSFLVTKVVHAKNNYAEALIEEIYHTVFPGRRCEHEWDIGIPTCARCGEEYA